MHRWKERQALREKRGKCRRPVPPVCCQKSAWEEENAVRQKKGFFFRFYPEQPGLRGAFSKTCPERKTFFFLLRKEMEENFLYKNFIRPAGTY